MSESKKFETLFKCCGGPDCPRIVRRLSDGALLVQGYKVKADDREELTVPTGEDLVEVPAELVAMLARATGVVGR